MHFQTHSLVLSATAFSLLVESSPVKEASPNMLEARAMAKRAITGIDCGLYSTADHLDTHTNMKNLGKKDGSATITANSCNRVGCYNTSGVYVCNDTSEDMDIPFDEIARQIQWIRDSCFQEKSGGFSGRFSNDLDGNVFNVNVGYCNGNDSPAVPPNGYTYPGPNGDAVVHCGEGKSTSCSFANCDKSSINIESQESVVCGEYLGGAYIPSGQTYTYSTTDTVGTSWNVGGWLGLDTGDLKKVTGMLGFSATYGETASVGNTAGTTGLCGEEGKTGNWTCTMDIAPKCWEMKGTCHATWEGIDLGNVPYAVVSPQMDSDDGVGVFDATLCVCRETIEGGEDCNGWDEDGAPEYICNLPCKSCGTPCIKCEAIEDS